MSWVEKRLKEYKKGTKPTFVERRNLEHANPVLFLCFLIAGPSMLYGFWTHDALIILFSVVVFLLGHVYVWM